MNTAGGRNLSPAEKGGNMPPDKRGTSDTAPPATGAPAGQTDPNRVDVTGIVPESVRVDPDNTEGHPGYEESGESEVIPINRLRGEATKAKDSPP